MQANKIVVGKEYAVQLNGLKRFRAAQVITSRGARGASSVVKGRVVETGDERTFDVEDLIGPYEEQAELVERRRREKEEQERVEQEQRTKREQARRVLYMMVGLPVPAGDPTAHDQMFRVTWDGIDIDEKGVEAVLQAQVRQERV